VAKVAPAFKVYSQAFSSKSACKRRSDDLTPSGKKVSIDCSGIERSETSFAPKARDHHHQGGGNTIAVCCEVDLESDATA
jgi:hypothetical protein